MNISRNSYPKFIIDDEKRLKAVFMEQIKMFGTKIGYSMGKEFQFKIDDYNSDVIEQLWFYVTNNSRFIGDHQKGILLSGNIGTGKTILMIAFLEVLKHTFKRNYTVLFPDTIHTEFKKNGLEHYRLFILMFDDLCREPKNVKDYGREIEPVRDLIMYRNRIKCQTYGTANFPVYLNGKLIVKNQLYTRYGAMIFDRMKGAFNFLELKGKSRR